jgi:AraC-like DNA-binding protein
MLAHPDFLRENPGVADPLSEILTFVDARGVVAGGMVGGGAWSLRFAPPRMIKFFGVARGACWLVVEGEPEPLRLENGDVVLLTAQRSFVIAGDLSVTPVAAREVFAGVVGELARVGSGETFFALGGHVALDPTRGALLLDVLPPYVHVRAEHAEATVLRWVLDQLVREAAADRLGTSLATAQLAQLMFVQVLRVHLETAASSPVGWLRALADERLVPALRLMHADPGRSWQLAELADAAAMSRTTFALRFKNVAGVAPLAYLYAWRMRLAERALREGDATVAEVAFSLGYTSESAFSNAFKRTVGTAPRRYRMALRGASVAHASTGSG